MYETSVQPVGRNGLPHAPSTAVVAAKNALRCADRRCILQPYLKAALQHLAVARYDKLSVRYEECSTCYEKLLDRSVRFEELSVRYEECSACYKKLLDRSVRFEELSVRYDEELSAGSTNISVLKKRVETCRLYTVCSSSFLSVLYDKPLCISTSEFPSDIFVLLRSRYHTRLYMACPNVS